MNSLDPRELVLAGWPESEVNRALPAINDALALGSPEEAWRLLREQVLKPEYPFEGHRLLYDLVFSDWPGGGPPPAWTPTDSDVRSANITSLMESRGFGSYAQLHRWSVTDREAFWDEAIRRLDVRFLTGYTRVMDVSEGVEAPHWLTGARMNIVDSCFGADADSTAIIFQREGGDIETMTLAALRRLANRVANAFVEYGFAADAVAVVLPMTVESVAVYLGVIKAGGVIVSIADSFMPKEIATRLRLGGAKGVFTQDVNPRGGKTLPLYTNVTAADAPATIVIPAGESLAVELRRGDLAWGDFLSADDHFDSVPMDPHDHCNILFSSGTTGEPKAIPWTHTTPIRCGADALYHHDVHPGDVLTWPTNLGWMMGPWLIFASLMNKASMALYYGAPTGAAFCRFVQDARVTMLGLVPSLVKAWRNADAASGLDWTGIKVFSSTGESSTAGDMLWLMSRAGYRPVIEYCGGTEIGGGYVTGTVVQPAAPATFSTFGLGLDAVILDENGASSENGELFLRPPSIGLSCELLNGDHHDVYFEGTPAGPEGEALRRHGDQMEHLGGGYYRAHGRVDDTMNLGGIKVSSIELERLLNTVAGVMETAAIAVSAEGGGPSLLVVYAVCDPGAGPMYDLKESMRSLIKRELNPLFKIHDVIRVDALPRTASNKVMRRVLRDQYGVDREVKA